MGKSALSSRAPKLDQSGPDVSATDKTSDPLPDLRRYDNSNIDSRPKVESARVDGTSYQDSSGVIKGNTPQQSSFLLNSGRQDLMGTLLNNYSTNSFSLGDSSIPRPLIGDTFSHNQQRFQPPEVQHPSYFLNFKDNNGNMPNDFNKPRGSSVQLHPLGQLTSNDFNLPSYGNNPISSRSNSIFSSLIQIPGSNRNSVSDASSAGNLTTSYSGAVSQDANVNGATDKANAFRGPLRARLLSYLPGLGVNQGQGQGGQISLEGLEGLIDKESGMLVAKQSGTGDPKSKPGSIDLSLWENAALPGSIAGLTGSLSDILAGISNSNVDFNNLSTEERRSSIMKIINDQNALRQAAHSDSQVEKTNLKEDIFEKQKVNSADSSRLPDEKTRISSESSMSSSKSSHYKDDPQSPKTFPQQYTIPPSKSAVNLSNKSPYQFSQPNGRYGLVENFPKPYDGTVPPPSVINKANDHQGYLHDSNQAYQLNRQAPEYAPNGFPNNKNNPEQRDDNNHLVRAQQYVKAEDGRPLLGVTKIDQLMLVIQARDKGVTNQIRQADDGSILASSDENNGSNVLPKPVSLVGGVDKPNKSKENNDNESKSKRKKNKNQQCPYCFKYFMEYTHLEVHVRSHIGYKPFECSYCHKRFTQGGNLRTHLRLHTGEKPFTCDVCNRSFSRKGNLAAHKLTHENLKPYECKLDNCDKSFTQLGNLKSHQNRFHLATLNEMTTKLAELSGPEINKLLKEERDLLEYFKELYKNSNKGIRGRGKRIPDERKQPPMPVMPIGEANRGLSEGTSSTVNQFNPAAAPMTQNFMTVNGQRNPGGNINGNYQV